jgi:hypothetical protein
MAEAAGDARANGFVYVLTSTNSQHIKIGGSDYIPFRRVKQINTSGNYVELGPWTIFNFRRVTDWRLVERSLHNAFRDRQAFANLAARELFSVAPLEAQRQLERVDPALLVGQDKVDRLFGEASFLNYLKKLFVFSGLPSWLNVQGAWTLSLYPSTSGGRFFTMNIGPHEVAYSSIGRRTGMTAGHTVVMDRLIYDFPTTVNWVKGHGGAFQDAAYDRALDRSVNVSIPGEFSNALALFALPGVRRAIIAYWSEALITLHEKARLSSFERFHNYNAVARLVEIIRHESGAFPQELLVSPADGLTT